MKASRVSSQNCLVMQGMLAATILLISTTGSSLTWRQKIGPLRDLESGGIQLDMHPFGSDPFNTSQGFRLFQGGSIPFDRAVTGMLRDLILNPLIEIRTIESTQSLSLSAGGQTQDFSFLVGGVAICDFKIRAHATARGDSLILGSAPDVDINSPILASDWPAVAVSYQTALNALEESYEASGASKLVDFSRCLRVVNGSLSPVWRMEIAIGTDPYEAIADSNVAYRISPIFFDVTGSAKVYANNVKDSVMTTFDLPKLIDDGTLTSTYLTTAGLANPRANKPSNTFTFSTSDAEFDEVSAYTHVQVHLSFFNSLGFKWYGPKPLQIHVHDPNEPNNAKFFAASKLTAYPRIAIGDADNALLANLATDADVVSHELGHFIIYQNLKTTVGQSMVLHEGLADFFTFSRTGNACLGESICPAGDRSACWSETLHECLRTAETALTFGGNTWEELKIQSKGDLNHQHGQAISGLLWDMRKDNAVPANDVTKLGFAAVSYLGDASGFRDFLLSLLLADKELFGSKYFDTIKSAATKRGFGGFITDVQKPIDGIPFPVGVVKDATDPAAGVDPVKTESTKSEKNPFKCGTLSKIASTSSDSNTLLVLLLLTMPLLLPRPVVTSALKAEE